MWDRNSPVIRALPWLLALALLLILRLALSGLGHVARLPHGDRRRRHAGRA